METLFDESVPVLLGFPNVDVTEAAFRPRHGEVRDHPLRRIVAQSLSDPHVEGGIDRYILGECIGHGFATLALARKSLAQVSCPQDSARNRPCVGSLEIS